MFPPAMCLKTRKEEAVRAGGETVHLIWIQALTPCRPAHCGPLRPHCNFISCHSDNKRRVASTHQTPGPPIPQGRHVRAHKLRRKTCMCAPAFETRKPTHSVFALPLTHSHTLPTLLHLSGAFFPLVGPWWAGGAGFLLGLPLPSRFRTARAGKQDTVERRAWRRSDRL